MTRIAAFDLDDTLIDTWTVFSEFLRAEGYNPGTATQSSYIILAPEALNRFHDEESLSSDRAALNAYDACSWLRDTGWELHVVTARSPVHLPRTIELVQNAFGDLFSEIHCVGPERPKRHRLQELGAEFFADDHPAHVSAALQAGIPSVLFGNLPWNHAETSLPRVDDWKTILDQEPWRGASNALATPRR